MNGKSIGTLVRDIYKLFDTPRPFSEDSTKRFATALAFRISNKASEERQSPSLRLSNIGTPCNRKLWYSVNQPESGEPLPPEARIKFLYGDILEETLLFLAREAGHDVQNEQATVEIAGVKGHIDGTIDGVLVDCKSASSYGFAKFRDHELFGNDSFGYLSQLGSYLFGSSSLQGLKDKSRAAFLAVDKTLGKICLDFWPKSDVDYTKVIEEKKVLVAQKEPPAKAFMPEAMGKSGNLRLGVPCSYCAHKKICWPGLRMFMYSSGPVFLTTVVKEPKDVREVVGKGLGWDE